MNELPEIVPGEMHAGDINAREPILTYKLIQVHANNRSKSSAIDAIAPRDPKFLSRLSSLEQFHK